MKRFGKIAVWTLAALVAVAGIGITATIGWRPFLGPRARATTNRTFERTPERLARGEYVANWLAGCVDCHSPHDWNQRGAPVQEGRAFTGDIFPLAGLPGRIVAPNITSDGETGLGSWTDDEIARAIREGISRDGRALFPLMPYLNYRHMPDEDLASVVVYLRSLAPVRNVLPATEIISPVRYLIRNVPEPIEQPVPEPDLSTPEKRGAHLVRIASCGDCHTPVRDGMPIPGMTMAGGMLLEGPWGRVTAPNLTTDPSGIPYYDEALFLEAIRTGMVRSRELNSIMPWHLLRQLTEQDLKDMFAYLKTVAPIAHRVDNAEPPTPCRLCGGTHGLGDRN
jgi:mono/diheme cytochrome c family protein